MTKNTTINTPVSITAIGFGRNMAAYPKRMEYAGTSYSFIDAGLRTIIRSGERIAEILTMSDGEHDYRLKTDNHTKEWMLLSIQ